MAAGLNHEVEAVAGAADADVEAGILLAEDECIFDGKLAEGVAEDAVLTLGGLVLCGVEEGARVGGPG